MVDSMFPETPRPRSVPPTVVERVVPRRPLEAIQQVLSISIHDAINDPEHRRMVREFYRITRRIQNEGWVRRQFRLASEEAWVRTHL